MNGKKWGILGLICTVAGAIISIFSSIIGGKQQDIKINEAVDRGFKSRGL